MSTLPSTPLPSAVRIRSIQPTLVSTAQSLKRQVRTRGGQRWGITMTWQNRTRALFMPIWAFLIARRGQWDTFTLTVPGHDTPQGTWAGGAPVVDGASQVGNTLNIKGLTPSQTGIAKAGDFIKPAGTTKVYMVTADANSDGSGKAALAIEPKLIASPADNEAIVYTAVPFTVAATQDTKEYQVASPLFFNFEVELIEAY